MQMFLHPGYECECYKPVEKGVCTGYFLSSKDSRLINFKIIVSVQVLFIPNSRVIFMNNAVKFIRDRKYICSIKTMTVMQG
ncbi:uncharacterized protein QE443_004778 [Pantoea ananatis]|nr:uncharacterized protein [Pantoea ananatis]MDR6092140.1 uncharacterized protein [Pantoea ananatis]